MACPRTHANFPLSAELGASVLADEPDAQTEIDKQLDAEQRHAAVAQPDLDEPVRSSEADEEPPRAEERPDKFYNVEAVTAFDRDADDARTVWLCTKWSGYAAAQSTWETELDLVAEGAAAAVYAFWARLGGRGAALGLDPRRADYVPYRILRRVPGARVRSVLVQWLGYDEAGATEETEKKMRHRAPALLREFLEAEKAGTAR